MTAQRRRLLIIAYGLALFIWLQVEDNTPVAVAIFGGGLAALLTFDRLARYVPSRFWIVGAALLGAIAGLGGVLATVALMLLKTGMHSHIFPDYPAGEMLDMLQRAPTWTLAGAFAGFGLALAVKALRR